ncbi:hypothetical protein K493DRAFT_305273 [Basidiobolus meristosporus CBS 931.73]|uniref:Uncharacterized protein n=1 Tax=Basidiobolus meristosporus CBS 931.73 TaxID=1314790 RepID=A0A1Y1XWC5_9FUNG|nr:hypothetical protein K493DRAFT_305273 [Basidiobolus meristosporus CBS 931.73]|eukprot:ORX90033.1 hypothetical protein K493DRAFT_305273 [Basidiobolus meristosporus CBS 931.73]
MKFFSLLTLTSLLLTGTYGCERDCKVAMDQEFSLRYRPVVVETLTSFEEELVTALSSKANDEPRLKSAVSRAVGKLHEEVSSDLSNIMHHGIFDKFHARCQRTDLEGCPNYYCPEVCGSPGSIIFYLQDVLERTRAGVIDKIKILTEVDGDFARNLSLEASSIDSNSREVEAIVRLQLTEFHRTVDGICEAGCFDVWTPGLISKLQEFD